MLHIAGELFVRTFRGRHGRFNIGKLVSPEGEFSVKDAIVDELDEGAYRGRFAIERLSLVNSQLPSGAIIVEMRARLASMSLDHDRPARAEEPVGVEQCDPLDEPDAPPPADPAPEPSTAVPADASPSDAPAALPVQTHASLDIDATPAPSGDAGEAAVFGELWPLGPEVQLDPSIGRALMRQQIEALKKRGYRYDAQRQVWRLAA